MAGRTASLNVAVAALGDQPRWTFRLYVAGQRPKSLAALANLKRLCDTYLTDAYHIEVIDLLLDPARAEADQIVAIPTLIRLTPPPMLKVFGDLSDEARALSALALPAAIPSREVNS